MGRAAVRPDQAAARPCDPMEQRRSNRGAAVRTPALHQGPRLAEACRPTTLDWMDIMNFATRPEDARRYDLDWLRVFAFGMLIFYHVGMFYVTWDWHVKSPSASPALEPAMLLINPWRLPLLFFISGVAIRFATDRTSLREFLPRRLMRLFLPLAFGMFVIVVPQAYAELRLKGEVDPGFLAFWRDYALFRLHASIITPTWNHLWYVAYMLVYTLLLAPFLKPLSRFSNGRGERFFEWVARSPRWRLLVAPALPFIGYQLLLDPLFPTTHALVDDWADHAHCLTMLLFGYFAAKSPAFWRAIDGGTVSALVVAAGLGFALTAARLHWDSISPGETVLIAIRAGRVLYGWAVVVVFLGLAQRYLNRRSTALSYLTEAVFPYYIVHQTAIVTVGYWLIPYRLPMLVEAAIVTGATVGSCLLGFEIVSRIKPLRPLFGLRLVPRARTAPAGAIPPAVSRSRA
jgi:surface polysaccharide O-acyltransferase-like enzyme